MRAACVIEDSRHGCVSRILLSCAGRSSKAVSHHCFFATCVLLSFLFALNRVSESGLCDMRFLGTVFSLVPFFLRGMSMQAAFANRSFCLVEIGLNKSAAKGVGGCGVGG